MLDRSEREEVRLQQPCCQTLPLSIYKGTWTHSPPLVAMHLLDRSCMSVCIFLKLQATLPNSGIRARSMRRTQRVVGSDCHTAYHQYFILIGGIVGCSAPDQPYMTTFMRPVPPTDMQLVLHKGGWRVSVSPTLLESNLTTAGPC